MTPAHSAGLRPCAFDTETALIRPACLAPPLVCVTWQRPGLEPRIADSLAARPYVVEWLKDPATLIVGHNVAYDLAVIGQQWPELLPSIFAAYEADRVTDTQIRQQLLDIAAGVYRGSVTAKGKRVSYEYTLEALAKRCAGMQLQKDAWRLSYGEFLGLPLAKWPARALEVQAAARPLIAQLEALAASGAEIDEKKLEGLRSMVASDPARCTTYPLDDARATLAVYQAQEVHASYLADQYRQARAAFALHLSSAWGLRTDPQGVATLRASIEEDLADVDVELKQLGLVREDGSKDTKVAKRRMIEVCAREGLTLVRTDSHFDGECTAEERKAQKLRFKCRDESGAWLDDGDPKCAEHVCLDADSCERSEDDVLIAYAEHGTLGKQLTNDIPALEGGIVYPVHTRYGFAGTGRTTSSKPNIQNQSKREGFREAFVPRPGKVFAQCDFPGLELYTWAQCCKTWFGFSDLADALNAGLDPHLQLAARLLGITYEDALASKKDPVVKRARDRAKPANFGFAGGMGVPKFLSSTRKGMGRKAFEALGLDEQKAQELKALWKRTWREADAHFKRAADVCGDGLGQVESLFTERHRGGTTYCATCNTPFQGLGADCAKHAAWLIAQAEYVDTASPLYGARTVAFVHDEFIVEVDDGPGAHYAAHELARLMAEGANRYLPDVPIPLAKMEPLLMLRWSKKAEPRFVADPSVVGGRRLVAWAP